MWFWRSRRARLEQQQPVAPLDAQTLLFGAKPKNPPAEQPAPSVPSSLVAAPPPPEPPEPVKAEPQPPPPEPIREIVTVPLPNDVQYRTPRDLMLGITPVRRALVIGACFSEIFPLYLGFAFPHPI